MTEYDYSPGAIEAYKRTQNRIAHWVDDTDRHTPQFRSPFVPRSDLQDNEFYHRSRSPSSSRRHTPSPSHSSRSQSSGRGTPQRSQTLHQPPTQPHVRSPLRSATISVVSPNDSISQAGAPRPSHSRHHRSHSSSPTRHSRSHRSHGTTYVVSPGTPPQQQYPGVQYIQAPMPMPYASPNPQGQQPAAYVVHARKVQVVYPDQTQQVYHTQYPPTPHPVQEHHASLLKRIFGSQSGKHSHTRTRSLSHSTSRSHSRGSRG